MLGSGDADDGDVDFPTSDHELRTNFETVRELGRGRFGEATLVRHLATGRQFALKRTKFGAAGQPDAQKVLVEARALSRLGHAHVVRYHATFSEASAVCILMEFAEGGDLSALLSARWEAAARASQSHLAEDEVVDWFVQLAEGLAHIHDSKVLHRDLKPENVFVCGGGRGGPSGVTLKIGDFGISRILQASAEMAKTCVGSPCYLSPEIVQGAAYGYKSDVWSLGVIVYRAMTNRFPFDADNLAQLALKITAGSFPPLSPIYSPKAHHLVASLLQIDPSHRPGMADVLATNSLVQLALARRAAAASGMPLSPAAAALTARSRIPVPRKPSSPRPNDGPGSPPLPQPPPVLTSPLTNSDAGSSPGAPSATPPSGGLKTASPETPLPAAARAEGRAASRFGREKPPRSRSPLSSPASAASAAAPASASAAGPASTRKKSFGGLPPKSPAANVSLRGALPSRGAPGLESSRTSCSSPGRPTARSMCSSPGVTARSATGRGSPRARSLTGSPLSTPGRHSPRSPSPGAAVRRAGSPGPQARPSAPKTPKTPKTPGSIGARRRPSAVEAAADDASAAAVPAGPSSSAAAEAAEVEAQARLAEALKDMPMSAYMEEYGQVPVGFIRAASELGSPQAAGHEGDIPEAAARLTPRSRDAFMLRLQRADSNDDARLSARLSERDSHRTDSGGSVGAEPASRAPPAVAVPPTAASLREHSPRPAPMSPAVTARLDSPAARIAHLEEAAGGVRRIEEGMGELAAAEQRASEAAAEAMASFAFCGSALSPPHTPPNAPARESFSSGFAGLRESLGGRPY